MISENRFANQFERNPRVVLLGEEGSGKTTLIAAFLASFAPSGKARLYGYEEYDGVPSSQVDPIRINQRDMELEVGDRRFLLSDYDTHLDAIKAIVAGENAGAKILLAVSAESGSLPQTQQQLLLARLGDLPSIVVFLSKTDLVGGSVHLDAVEADVRALLDRCGFPGATVPVVRGSALAALTQGGVVRGDLPSAVVEALATTMDASFGRGSPPRLVDGPYLQEVEGVFSLAERGTAVTGHIRRGVVGEGDNVEMVGMGVEGQTGVVAGIAMFGKALVRAEAGDVVGCCLQGVAAQHLARGQVLAAPRSIRAHTAFTAFTYVTTATEGGRQDPYQAGFHGTFHIWDAYVSGSIILPEGVSLALLGTTVVLGVRLAIPVALERGVRFTIHEGRARAYGIVLDVGNAVPGHSVVLEHEQ